MVGQMVCLKGYPELWGMIITVDKDLIGDIWVVELKFEIRTLIQSYSTNFELVHRLHTVNPESKVTDVHSH